jgi:hydrogenase nickel incorporation protein HypA/HybF
VHELALASAVVEAVVRHAEGRRVTVVSMRIGALRQVVPESLEFCFGIVARESVCEGARLDYEVVPAALSCRDCGSEWKLERPPFTCPSCNSGVVKAVAGEEFLIESIELEEAEACIALG